MLRYENEAQFVIKIPINEPYVVYANAKYDKETGIYTINYELNATTDYIKFEAGQTEIKSDMQNIRRLILKDVADRYYSKEFQEIIDQYEYIMQCFDIGDDVLKQSEGQHGKIEITLD